MWWPCPSPGTVSVPSLVEVTSDRAACSPPGSPARGQPRLRQAAPHGEGHGSRCVLAGF